MFPTVGDQLRATRRILRDIVGPEVGGDYTSETLAACLGTLEMLQTAWEHVLPFLRWDNRATADLLALLTGSLGGELEDRAAALVAADDDCAVEFDDLHRRNLELRQALSEAVRAGHADEGITGTRIREHFRERIARYPFRSTASMPRGDR